MSRKDSFEELVRNDLEVRASGGIYDRMHHITLEAHGSTETANTPILTRRTVMEKAAVKLALATVVIAAVTFGLFEFLSPGGSSGVVWADVARKVEASRGFISRMRQTQTIEGMDRPMEFYTMTYNSPYGFRMENFHGNELTTVTYADYKSGTMVSLHHNLQRYTRQTLPASTAPEGEEAMNPRSIVTDFLAGDYRELGRRTVEGVEAEGIEVTKVPNSMANFHIDNEVAQLWVGVETGYPLKLESKIVGNGGKVKIEMIIDQFQWDVQFDPRAFTTEIPPDYEQLEILPGGVMRGRYDGP